MLVVQPGDSDKLMILSLAVECKTIHRWSRKELYFFVGVTFIKFMTDTVLFYFSGMNLELWVAPIPGRPCFTGL